MTPIRVLELRSVRGTGGGPEKTILAGAARSDPARFAITVCYIRDQRDRIFTLDTVARDLGVDYVEVSECHSFDWTIWPAVREVARSRRIDIVHAHEYKTDFLALMLARAGGMIPLATVHGWTGQSTREKVLYYPVDRWLLRHYPRVIAVSSSIRDHLIRSGVPGERISTVLNGIDINKFRRNEERVAQVRASLNFPPSATIIGSVGRLERQKRFDVLIGAVAALRTGRPDVRLVIAGTGSLGPALEAAATRAGIADICLFAGHRTDIADLVPAFDLFVQSSDYEGTPNAVLEAMALETPVVATTAGGTGELIEDGRHGLLVQPGDPKALAAAIAVALNDPEAAARRAAQARQRVECNLSFDMRMRTVEGIYEALADGRKESGPARKQP